jgi:hypothetical protein
MFFHFLIALGVAVALSFILVQVLGRDKALTGFLVFMVIIMLMSWAGGVWMRPIGPAAGGIYWLPFVLTGLLVALLIGAFHYTQSVRSAPIPPSKKEEKVHTAKVTTELGLFFWALLVVLIVVIGVAYF